MVQLNIFLKSSFSEVIHLLQIIDYEGAYYILSCISCLVKSQSLNINMTTYKRKSIYRRLSLQQNKFFTSLSVN